MTLEEWLKEKDKRKNPFNFFGGRQYLPQDEYEATMEKRWRNPWHTYGKEAGKTAPVYADKILRDEAMRRSSAEQFRAKEAARAGMPTVNARTTPEMLTSMQSGMQPMDMTRYYKERDTSFAGAMAKTLASGLAKAAKPPQMRGGRVRFGGGQRTFTPDPYEMASSVAPTAPSGYGETIDPTIETYLRPWRLKHGYT
jgi:hypothetical protein